MLYKIFIIMTEIYLGQEYNGMINVSHELEVQLINIKPLNNGRYPISRLSLKNSISYIEKIKQNQNPIHDEVIGFLICISAILQNNLNNGKFKENNNVIYNTEVIHGYDDNIPNYYIKINEIMKYFEMYKVEQMLKYKNIKKCITEYNEYLGNNNKMYQILYNIPENNIPYILLKKNIYSNYYDIPLDINAENFYTMLKNENPELPDNKWFSNGDRTKCSILIVNNIIDNIINTKYRDTGLYKFVRIDNLIQLCDIFTFNRSQNTEFYGIHENKLYIKVGEDIINISTNVIFGIIMFCSYRGFLNRVGDIYLPDITNNINNYPIQQTTNLSTEQIRIIMQLGSTLPININPQRDGDDIEEIEKGVGIAITQITNNNRTSYLEGLKIIFSDKRSEKILDTILFN